MAAVTLVSGCSDIIGIHNLEGPADASATRRDTAADAASNVLYGIVKRPAIAGAQPVDAATITFYADSPSLAMVGAPVVTPTNGRFSIPAEGAPRPLDGFFKIEQADLLVGYAHLVMPVDGAVPAQSIVAYAASDVRALATAAGTTFMDGTSLVVVTVVESDGTPVTAISVTASTPTCYERNGAPTCSATSTDATGRAWFFSVPATDNFVVSASEPGASYSTSFPVDPNTSVITGARR